jgi:large subunit ribosomal protein L6
MDGPAAPSALGFISHTFRIKRNELKTGTYVPENLSLGGNIMSRIGRLPVVIPAGVTAEVTADNTVTVKGPKGQITKTFAPEIGIEVKDNEIHVTRPNDQKKEKSLHGLTRALIHNMVVGVTEGFTKTLEINGVGYRAQKQGNKLVLSLGYSHPVEMIDPEGIESTVENNKIIIKGISKEAVGQYAANIRVKRPPEPYKGKGIKYSDEVIRRKVGKTGKK